MAILDHWHPVIRSKDVQGKPVQVCLDNREIVLFRGPQGKLTALADRCCHRGMRLSKGQVCDGQLVCPYHGWRYCHDGKLITTSVPAETHRTANFDVDERYGLIWIRQPGSDSGIPDIPFGDFEYVGTLFHQIEAPLEVALDNFTEVEHTGAAHAYFGYAQDDVAGIETKSWFDDDTVSVRNRGKQRHYPLLLKPFVEFRKGDWFSNNWTTYFSPVYTFYDQTWHCPKTGRERTQRLRIAIFFNPINDDTTQIVTLIYSRLFYGKFLFRHVVRHIITQMTRFEVGLDKTIIGELADKNTELRGMQLGRFDQPLVWNRRMINSIYRGMRPEKPLAVESSKSTCPT